MMKFNLKKPCVTVLSDDELIRKVMELREQFPYMSAHRVARKLGTSRERLEKLGVSPPKMTDHRAISRMGRKAMEKANPQWVAKWGTFATERRDKAEAMRRKRDGEERR
jgi:hypothetical protein